MKTFFIKEKDNFLNIQDHNNNYENTTFEKEERNYDDIKSFDNEYLDDILIDAESAKNHSSIYTKSTNEEYKKSITIQKFSFKNKLIFIKELNNYYFILGFQDNLTIVDKEFNKKKVLKMDNKIYNICVREQNEGIIVCCENETKLINLNNSEDFIFNNSKIINKTSFACVEISQNNHIICHDIGVFHYIDYFDITSEEINTRKISDKSYRGVISIDGDKVAITSNKNISNGDGEDKLLFYYTIPYSVIGEKKGYSFNLCSNGLSLISNVKNKYKILLCTCKSSEKNGILNININDEYKEEFIDTKDFEVYCFCQVFEKTNRIFDNNNKENGTDFILVGGYEHNEKRGIVKVYKVEAKLQKIEYTNFRINNEIFYESKAQINNIIQIKNNTEILIGSSDGSIYLVDTPDIEEFSADSKIGYTFTKNY